MFSIPSGMLTLVIFITFWLAYQRNVRVARRKITALASSTVVRFPLVLSVSPWSKKNRLTSMFVVVLFVFPLFSAIGFFFLLFLGRYVGLVHEFGQAVAGVIFGAVSTVIAALQFPELKPINEETERITKTRELIFENGVLKVSRSLYSAPLSPKGGDEEYYYAIPLGSSAAVELLVWRGDYGWQFYYKIKDRDRSFVLLRRRLGYSEAQFVTALKQLGVRTIGF